MISRKRWVTRFAVCGLLTLPLASGCATTGSSLAGSTLNSIVPTRFETRVGPYIVYTHNPLPTDAPMVRHLQSLERQLEATLGVRVDPSEQPIEIYVLSDQQTFDHFLRTYYPELPIRRAFFLAQGSRQVVYTYFNPRLEVDVRHEATHALLHLAYADLPLWLDEGLAEYFEVPEESRGVNAEHLAKLPGDRSAGWIPDLARLEGVKDVRQLSPRDYRESWGWAHYLIHGSPTGKATLLAYLADLKKAKGEIKPLSDRLNSGFESDPAEAMAAYIVQVREPAARGDDTVTRAAATKAAPGSAPAAISRDTQPQSFMGRLFDRPRN
jgi:hypothetical protein